MRGESSKIGNEWAVMHGEIRRVTDDYGIMIDERDLQVDFIQSSPSQRSRT
jgi:hypothetical protein